MPACWTAVPTYWTAVPAYWTAVPACWTAVPAYWTAVPASWTAVPAYWIAVPAAQCLKGLVAGLGRIGIGCGSHLVFERRPETKSTARFIKDAGQSDSRVRPRQTRVQNPPKPGYKTSVPWFCPPKPGYENRCTLVLPSQTRVRKPLYPGFAFPNQGTEPLYPGFFFVLPWIRNQGTLSRRFYPGLGLQIQGMSH